MMAGFDKNDLVKLGEALIAMAQKLPEQGGGTLSDQLNPSIDTPSDTSTDTGGFQPKRKSNKAVVKHKMGWLPDPVDNRDFTLDEVQLKNLNTPKADAMAEALGTRKISVMPKAARKTKIDLRGFCSAVENQGDIGSCTANAVVGLIEYFATRKGELNYQGSRLFLYKMSRRLDYFKGDTGAHIRTALRAATSIGVPPENYWPYTDDPIFYDSDPDNFAYALADNYRASSYFRFDPAGATDPVDELLRTLKKSLVNDMPFAFGFDVYVSIWEAPDGSGHIPLPSDGEDGAGGHAVMAVGYDNNKTIIHPKSGVETKGAFLIRNSWGTGWGEAGYGWLPYDYITTGRANDFWTIYDMRWLETRDFESV